MIIEFYATSTLVSGNRYVTIPTDLRIIRYVQLKDTTCYSKRAGIFRKKRHHIIWQLFMILQATAQGLPKYYANWDANFWVVAPTPNSTYEITLAYVKQP